MLATVIAEAPPTTDGRVWVTSAWRPGDTTLHSTGEAYDIRIKNVKGFDVESFTYNELVALWARNVQRKLGSDYDIVYETNHIHLEYDPK